MTSRDCQERDMIDMSHINHSRTSDMSAMEHIKHITSRDIVYIRHAHYHVDRFDSRIA